MFDLILGVVKAVFGVYPTNRGSPICPMADPNYAKRDDQ